MSRRGTAKKKELQNPIQFFAHYVLVLRARNLFFFVCVCPDLLIFDYRKAHDLDCFSVALRDYITWQEKSGSLISEEAPYTRRIFCTLVSKGKDVRVQNLKSWPDR